MHVDNLADHSNQKEEQNFWQPSQKEVDCHQSLRTSDYESYKERNPDRVEGTCRWFLEHPHFQYWWKSKTSNLLWVSADPGCGKSVLAKSLVAEELKSTKTHTTCYFFFKDDNVEQTSATNALCALLHQLLEQRKPLVKHAMSDFRSNGVYLHRLFERLWSILKEAAADAETGTVVCIIDALDECEESGRTKLLSYLDHFYNNTTTNDRKNMVLKFLITSRPYFHIERSLQGLISKHPVIRLAGEAETLSISREINLVIKVEVQKLGKILKLDDSVRLILEEGLLKFKNRTYLWLHLILEVVRRRLETVSQKKIRDILSSVPETVDKAYTAILERSENKRSAKKLLNIIVSAVRPLTLREMDTAMAIEATCTSYDDLDLVPEEKCKVIIRNLCGLFVTIIDSRIYLIHQTAREFLLSNSNPVMSSQDQNYTRVWKHSIKLEASNLILARICIWYLLFAVFEIEGLKPPPGLSGGPIRSGVPPKKDILDYTSTHPFLSYAANYWALHFREAHDDIDVGLLQSVSFKICNTQSLRFSNWFPVYWTMSKEYESFYPHDFDSLMVASHLGLHAVVQLFLQDGLMVNSLDSLKRTALSWAAEAGNDAVVELLLDRGTDQIGKNRGRSVWGGKTKEYRNRIKSVFRSKVDLPEQQIDVNSADAQNQTSLMLGAKNGHRRVVELLLERNAETNCTDQFNEIAAMQAAKNGHEDIVVIFLERNAWTKPKNKTFGPALILAAGSGQGAVVKILLDRGINKEFKNEAGRTALAWAANRGNPDIVKLLLEYDADIEAKDKEGLTPLMHAVKGNHKNTVAFLLDHNAVVEAKNNAGRSAMSLAFVMYDNGPQIHWGAFGLLLEHGATMTSNGSTDLVICQEAARRGDIHVMRYLLERRDLSIESKSESYNHDLGHGLTPLSLAAIEGHRDMVEFLLERNANVEARDNNGTTPLSWATRAFRATVVDLLLEHDAFIESRNNQGRTALLDAVEVRQRPKDTLYANEAVVEVLLNHGANAEVKDNDGMTPLLWAVRNSWEGVIKRLLEHNVKTDCRNQDGRTAWQLAEFLGEKTVIIQFLKHDTDTNFEQNWSRTSLSEAAEKGSDLVVKQYLEEDHDIEAKDDIFGQSPLLWAAENGHEAVVRVLLEHNAQIESENKYGQTALWLAVRHGHARMVQVLVERNAIADMQDNASRTPLEMARFYQYTGIEVLLERHLARKNNMVRAPASKLTLCGCMP